jgi:hypothetical protein
MSAEGTSKGRSPKAEVGANSKVKRVEPSSPNRNWRSFLKRDDEAELLRWIETSGLERVARIVATLAGAGRRHGQPRKLEIALLLKVASLLRQQPERTLHSVAHEVVHEAHPNRKPRIAVDSLVSKLERDFRMWRHGWLRIAKEREAVDDQKSQEETNRLRSSDEHRVLVRLIELLPGAIDLYDRLLMEAKQAGPEQARLVKRLGRRRVEPLLETIIERLVTPRGNLGASCARVPPRSLFEAIEPELTRLQEERNSNATRARRVGR